MGNKKKMNVLVCDEKRKITLFCKRFQLLFHKKLSHVLKEHSCYYVFGLPFDAMLCVAVLQLYGRECRKNLQLGNGDTSRGHRDY